MKTHVNIDVLSKKASEIEKYIDDFSTYSLKLKNDIADMKSAWTGSSSNNFQNKMADLNDEIKKLEKSLDSYNDFLKKYVNEVKAVEEKYKSENISIN